jgi:hypothetical protein
LGFSSILDGVCLRRFGAGVASGISISRSSQLSTLASLFLLTKIQLKDYC